MSQAGRRLASAGAPKGNLFKLLRPYRPLVMTLVAMTVIGNGMTLVIPKIISAAIDGYAQQRTVSTTLIVAFSVVALGVLLFSYFQVVAQTYASERVARDLRTKLIDKISRQDHAF